MKKEEQKEEARKKREEERLQREEARKKKEEERLQKEEARKKKEEERLQKEEEKRLKQEAKKEARKKKEEERLQKEEARKKREAEKAEKDLEKKKQEEVPYLLLNVSPRILIFSFLSLCHNYCSCCRSRRTCWLRSFSPSQWLLTTRQILQHPLPPIKTMMQRGATVYLRASICHPTLSWLRFIVLQMCCRPKR